MKASMSGAYWAVALGVLLPLSLFLVIQSILPGWKWVYGPLHSVLEALGFFAAMVLAVILLLQQDRKNNNSHYIWIAVGLISMGVLDGCLASVAAGNNFLWLHSLAVLAGVFYSAWCGCHPACVGSQTHAIDRTIQRGIGATK